MIDSVRKTVLSILNKNNYGFVTPADFNLYAKQAQLDIFDDYFYDYNYQINKENARASGTGYADIKKGYEEVIDGLSETKFLTNRIIGSAATNMYSAPSQATTGDDYYLINRVETFPKEVFDDPVNTSTTAGGANQLIDTTIDPSDPSVTFLTLGVSIGDVAVNLTTGNGAIIISVAANTLILDRDVFPLPYIAPIFYSIFDASEKAEAEMVSQAKIMQLNISLLTAPTTMFPVYTLDGDYISVYPNNGTWSRGKVLAQYIRYPKDPKWTYITLAGGEPAFASTQADYQDFELAIDDQVDLVIKILQYAGMSIREVQAVQFGQAQEQLNIQEEK